MKHIVIIGGGFAGINLVNRLAGNPLFTVTLVDKNNYHFFPPLLYQVATGILQWSNISFPFRSLLRKKKNMRFHLGELQRILPAQQQVVLSTGILSYDYLVLAVGATTNYFGMTALSQQALPMKTLHDALELRNHILQQLELAAVETNEEEREKRMTIVIAGGGPTGVEIAGMLANLRKTVLPRDYPTLVAGDTGGAIYLVDGTDTVLKPMSERSQEDTYRALRHIGVRVQLNRQVTGYANGTVTFSNGDTIGAYTLVWAAGVTGTVWEGLPAGCYGRSKRLITDAYNRVISVNNIFAIGDASLQTHEKQFAAGHPQLAQVAIQQGRLLAANLTALEKEKPLKPFVYRDKGSMAIIGLHKAVVDLPNKTHFKGFVAWAMWLFVHLVSLISHRNRITTLYNWTVAYFTRDQSLRMIIRPGKK